jgi:transcription elongation GreA/GreB family factor
LEELLRKGTPAALAEANEIMKVMSGYDQSTKRDYKGEVNEEISRIESRIILLNDMLNETSAEDFKRKLDSTIEVILCLTQELYSSAKVAQSRLQKFIDDNEDEERMARLLELNGFLHID